MDKILEEKLINLNLMNVEDLENLKIRKELRNVHIKELFLIETIKEEKYNLIEYSIQKNIIKKDKFKEVVSRLKINDKNKYLKLLEINNDLTLIPELLSFPMIEPFLLNDRINIKRKIDYVKQIGRNYVNNSNTEILIKTLYLCLEVNIDTSILYTSISNKESIDKLVNLSSNKRNKILNSIGRLKYNLAIEIANQYIDIKGIEKFLKFIKSKNNKIFNTEMVLTNLKSIYQEQIKYNKMLETF